MNQRIKELAEQAGYKPLPGFDLANTIEETYLEKFAQLIVRDVVATVKRTQTTSPDFEWAILNNYDIGVEE
jgi:hypothetical protein